MGTVLVISAILYFIPAIVGRKKRHASAVFWLSFLLGRTVVGWVAVLIWAVVDDPLPTQLIVSQRGEDTREWRLQYAGRVA